MFEFNLLLDGKFIENHVFLIDILIDYEFFYCVYEITMIYNKQEIVYKSFNFKQKCWNIQKNEKFLIKK